MNNFCSWAWDATARGIQFFDSWQPAIATGSILGKLSWRLYRQRPLKREIAQLENRIDIIRRLRPEERKTKMKEILESDLKEKKRQLHLTKLTYGEIPSLFFAHPGSNLYQVLHRLFGRGVYMSYLASPLCPGKNTLWHRSKNIAALVGSCISLAGTMASLCRMTGAIDVNNQAGHYLTRAASIVHWIEGIWMTHDVVKKIIALKEPEASLPDPINLHKEPEPYLSESLDSRIIRLRQKFEELPSGEMRKVPFRKFPDSSFDLGRDCIELPDQAPAATAG